jgi:hypothetical protein
MKTRHGSSDWPLRVCNQLYLGASSYLIQNLLNNESGGPGVAGSMHSNESFFRIVDDAGDFVPHRLGREWDQHDRDQLSSAHRRGPPLGARPRSWSFILLLPVEMFMLQILRIPRTQLNHFLFSRAGSDRCRQGNDKLNGLGLIRLVFTSTNLISRDRGSWVIHADLPPAANPSTWGIYGFQEAVGKSFAGVRRMRSFVT